jgi:hypothetical protein
MGDSLVPAVVLLSDGRQGSPREARYQPRTNRPASGAPSTTDLHRRFRYRSGRIRLGGSRPDRSGNHSRCLSGKHAAHQHPTRSSRPPQVSR